MFVIFHSFSFFFGTSFTCLITLHASEAAVQCIVIAPVYMFVCGSALLHPAHSVCVASEHFFIFSWKMLFLPNIKVYLVSTLKQGCVRGQHFRGQDQWSSRLGQGQRSSRPKILRPRSRPVIFVMKDSQVWVAQKVWNPQVNGSNSHGYICVNACVKLGTACNFMQTCECCISMET